MINQFQIDQQPAQRARTTRLLPFDDANLAVAVETLQAGGLVSFATETVYGLGADATNDRAVAGIFTAKGRPRFNPLIVHLPSADAVWPLVVADERARRLAEHFWPGALTLVLPRAEDCPVSLLCSAGLDSLAVRVPAHRDANRLLQATGRPVAAPSANASGQISATSAAHVEASLGGAVDVILDSGPCPIGVESTVVSLIEPQAILLRPGGVTREAIEAVIGPLELPADSSEAAPLSPGRLTSHYAPGLPLRLDAIDVRPDEALLAFGPEPLAGAALTLNLSSEGDLAEAAAHLFDYLRRLDRPDLAGIAAMPVPYEGLGLAINDRLARAAAPR